MILGLIGLFNLFFYVVVLMVGVLLFLGGLLIAYKGLKKVCKLIDANQTVRGLLMVVLGIGFMCLGLYELLTILNYV